MKWNQNNFKTKYFNEYNTIAGDKDPQAIKISVENCNEEYCEVKRNTPAKMEFTFKPTKQATELTGTVNAQVLGTWIPWPIGAAGKVCKNLVNGECPVAENTEATYRLNFKIPGIAPVGTKTVVQFRITDQTKATVACVRFPVLVAA